MDRVDLEPPSGSRISVTTDGACPVVVIPHAKGGPARYLIGLFALCFLSQFYWKDPAWSDNGPAIYVFTLALSILAALLAVYTVYRVFAPSVPESLKLTANGVEYDPGVPPLRYDPGDVWQREFWRSMFPKRTRLEIDRQKLQSLRLRETDVGNRLTVDVGVVRHHMAESVGGTERKWLYRLLANRYSLPVEQGNAPTDHRW